ncbi:MAG: ABC transporter permease [Alphaproteobacteria bacterium HGW-Alphaproteobacteria-8]|nr:MAG: ABC transporter permease [Alphaproteobacteria bacterium HGW-Alphaproteobacteria-8]
MSAGAGGAPEAGLTLRERLEGWLALIGPMAMIAALLLLMAALEPARYFRLSNFDIILKDAALYMPMAMAMTIVIVTRGIDLSIGSVAALTAIVMGYMLKSYGFPWWVAVPLAIALGALCGLINGLIITKLRVPDLIGTLAMDLAYRGLALVLAKGIVLSRFPDEIVAIGRGQIPGFLPIPVVIGLSTIVMGYFIYTRTRLGRYAVAIGSNPEAAELTGVPVNRYKIYVYVLMGAMAGLAGVMLAGKLNAVQATSAPFFNLHVIAAVVVGGTSLFGGRGSMLGSLAGVLLLAMMINALVTLRIEFFWQSVASGAVIILSVAFYTWLQMKDRDGQGGLLAALRTPENRRLGRFILTILAIVAALFALGWLFAGETSAVR